MIKVKNSTHLLMKGGRITQKTRETIRKLSEHLAPFPVFEQPKEEQLLIKWQQTCVDNGLLMPETVLTHTYYRFDSLKQFRSNNFFLKLKAIIIEKTFINI